MPSLKITPFSGISERTVNGARWSAYFTARTVRCPHRSHHPTEGLAGQIVERNPASHNIPPRPIGRECTVHFIDVSHPASFFSEYRTASPGKGGAGEASCNTLDYQQLRAASSLSRSY